MPSPRTVDSRLGMAAGRRVRGRARTFRTSESDSRRAWTGRKPACLRGAAPRAPDVVRQDPRAPDGYLVWRPCTKASAGRSLASCLRLPNAAAICRRQRRAGITMCRHSCLPGLQNRLATDGLAIPARYVDWRTAEDDPRRRLLRAGPLRGAIARRPEAEDRSASADTTAPRPEQERAARHARRSLLRETHAPHSTGYSILV